MPGVRFSRMSPEESCSKEINDPCYHEPVACLRRAGHEGPCVPMACDAARADGVCFYCRAPSGTPHHPDCNAATPTGFVEYL